MVIEKASVSDNWAGGGTEQANKAGSQALNRGLIMRPGCCRVGQTSTQSSEKQVPQSLPGGQSSPRHRSSSSDGDEDDSHDDDDGASGDGDDGDDHSDDDSDSDGDDNDDDDDMLNRTNVRNHPQFQTSSHISKKSCARQPIITKDIRRTNRINVQLCF